MSHYKNASTLHHIMYCKQKYTAINVQIKTIYLNFCYNYIALWRHIIYELAFPLATFAVSCFLYLLNKLWHISKGNRFSCEAPVVFALF